jgi:TRAP-type C4-dicarboxylate transport system permease small subunit
VTITERFVRKICNWGTVVGAVFLLANTLIILATVAGRALHIALPGTFDLVETSIVVSIAFAIVFGQLQDRHIRAEIAIERFKGRTKSGIESFIGILNIGYWAVLLYAAFVMMKEKWQRGEESNLLNIPVVPFRAVFVFSLILMVILLIFKEILHIKGVIRAKEEK